MAFGKGNTQAGALWPLSVVLLIMAQVECPASEMTVCKDDPLVTCSVLDKESHICTTFRYSQETQEFCPKYCGLCGPGSYTTRTKQLVGARTSTINSHPGTSSTVKTSTSPSPSPGTPASFTGLCLDDPNFNCASMDRSIKICTVFRDSRETKEFCPKYCGLCGSNGLHLQPTSTKLPTTGSTMQSPERSLKTTVSKAQATSFKTVSAMASETTTTDDMRSASQGSSFQSSTTTSPKTGDTTTKMVTQTTSSAIVPKGYTDKTESSGSVASTSDSKTTTSFSTTRDSSSSIASLKPSSSSRSSSKRTPATVFSTPGSTSTTKVPATSTTAMPSQVLPSTVLTFTTPVTQFSKPGSTSTVKVPDTSTTAMTSDLPPTKVIFTTPTTVVSKPVTTSTMKVPDTSTSANDITRFAFNNHDIHNSHNAFTIWQNSHHDTCNSNSCIEVTRTVNNNNCNNTDLYDQCCVFNYSVLND